MIHEPLDHGTIQGLLADPESQSRRNAQKAAGCGEEFKKKKSKVWESSTTTWDVYKPVNNWKNYQHQLVQEMSSINSILGGGFKYCFFSPRTLGK